MNQIPNVSVGRSGFKYQKAAELCLKFANEIPEDIVGVAIVNAAFAIELYIKSFLAEKVITKIEGKLHRVTAKTPYEHDLIKLYRRIDPKYKTLIQASSSKIDPNINFEEKLKNYKNYFFHSRYQYELNTLPCVDTEIITFCNHVRLVMLDVAKST